MHLKNGKELPNPAVKRDCAVEAKRIEAAGGEILKEKSSIGEYGYIVPAFDTEGNLFGLHSM